MEQKSNIQNEASKKKHKCSYPDCHAVFLRPSRLERHIRLHTGERPYKCSHPECTKSYTNSSHLKRHLETHNRTKKVYKCTKCLVSIGQFHNLKRHYKRMHGEENRLVCEECDKTFNKRCQFADHRAAHSATPTIYKCDKCSRSYQNYSRFKRHRQSHKSYPCPNGCSEIFDTLLLLHAHIKTKHVTHYKCDTCDKVFLNKSRIREHCKIHLEKRLVLPCPYDDCLRVYFFKSNLDEHVRIMHHGKRFYCNLCSMGLTSKQRLLEHIQRHYKVKEESKVKAPRKKRKDIGVPKKSVITALIGVDMPYDLEKMILNRETTMNNTAKDLEILIN
ncbi:PREDICTED: zinc finger protein 525-like [Vollenhovia emeryi]|uniref:zinc finger protein 525-like n=1 Tax=Vollenhovia emeryi TaxID=411798 RepID=UPI0005F553F5|nr:PREDICTED: zinc finger protein 525-like [Vollenhovia emeryi]